MSQSLVKKVAEAVWERTGINISVESSKHIIKAMKEPTEEMLKEVDEQLDRETSKYIYKAMIERSLKE